MSLRNCCGSAGGVEVNGSQRTGVANSIISTGDFVSSVSATTLVSDYCSNTGQYSYHGFDVIDVSDGVVLLAYTDCSSGTNNVSVRLCSVNSDGTLNLGTPTIVATAISSPSYYPIQLCKMYSGRFILLYDGQSTTSYAYARVIDVSGNTLTIGSPYQVYTNSSQDSHYIFRISDTVFGTISNKLLTVCSVPTSSRTITVQSATTLDTTVLHGCGVAITETKFLLTYFGATTGCARIATMDASYVITLYPAISISDYSYNGNGMENVCKINDSLFVTFLQQYICKGVNLSISGTTVSNAGTFDLASSVYYYDLHPIDDAGNFEGTCRIGSSSTGTFGLIKINMVNGVPTVTTPVAMYSASSGLMCRSCKAGNRLIFCFHMGDSPYTGKIGSFISKDVVTKYAGGIVIGVSLSDAMVNSEVQYMTPIS